MRVFHLEEEVKRLRRTGEEVGHRVLVDRPGGRAGIAVFHPRGAAGRKAARPGEIAHADLDVLAHVLEGSGTLTVGGESRGLAPGMVLHLPAGTPHDFAAGEADLVLFYALIRAEGD